MVIILTIIFTSFVFWLSLPKGTCWNIESLDKFFSVVIQSADKLLNSTLPKLFETFSWSVLVLIIALPPFQKHAIKLLQEIGRICEGVFNKFHPYANISPKIEDQTQEDREKEEKEEEAKEAEISFKQQSRPDYKNRMARRNEIRQDIIKYFESRPLIEKFRRNAKVVFFDDPIVDKINLLCDASYSQGKLTVLIRIYPIFHFSTMFDRFYKQIRSVYDFNNQSSDEKMILYFIFIEDEKENNNDFIASFEQYFAPALRNNSLQFSVYNAETKEFSSVNIKPLQTSLF